MQDNITEKDRLRLRDLAKRQLEFSHSPRNQQLFREWELHGQVTGSSRPMITVELWTFAAEMINPLLACESEEARSLESMLLNNTYNFEHFHDDTVVRNYIGYSEGYRITPFGLTVRKQESGGLGHHFIPQVKNLTDDFHLLQKSVLTRYNGGSWVESARDVFGDILPVKKIGNAFSVCLLQDIVHIMGMENMYTAMAVDPELFHQMCTMLTNDYIELIELTESEGLLSATNKDTHLGQGSMCFTDDLPAEGKNLKSSQIWIYMDAQEATGISPAMYHEFVYPYYKRISEKFGLLSYGCCEAVHPFWDDVSSYKNMQKVSVSPWCDENFAGRALQGMKTVYHRKPSPNFLGVTQELDEDAVKAHIQKTVDCASGLTLEITQRDVYTVHQNPSKVERYVTLIREICEGKK